jgi:hypothetical protein
MSFVCCGVELMDCFDLCLLLLVFMLVFFFDDVRTYNRGVIQASATSMFDLKLTFKSVPLLMFLALLYVQFR